MELKITPSVITEYLAMENNPRWYFAFIGDLAVTEPFVWGWITEMALKDIVDSTEDNVPSPVAIKLNVALRRMFLRGIYFGKKHELSNWRPEFIETPLTDKASDVPIPRISGDLTKWGEASEIADEDFN